MAPLPRFFKCFLPVFRLVVVTFACAIFAVSALAQDAPSGKVPLLPDTPFAATAAQLQATSAAVPVDREYDVQILFEEAKYRIASDGTMTHEYRLVFRVDSKEAMEGWSELSMRWDPWNEKPAELHARVLRVDGQFVELDQKTITDAPIKGDDSETYSSEHERRAPIPGMEVGSIVEQVQSVEEKVPYFAAGSLYRYRFQSGVPIARSRLSVEMPASMPYKDSLHDLPAMVPNSSEAGGVRRVVYEKFNIPAGHDSDIDLSTNEPDTPMVEFATGASWQAVAAAYEAMSEPQTVVEDAKTILPANLPAGRAERVRAIVARLHSEVRYTGIEFGASKLTPTRPSEVIQRHYGDCKDKATLLVAMLRSADIPANLALLSTGPGLDVSNDLPGMTQFDHAIVYVPEAGNEPAIWIDATAQYYTPGSLPFDDEGRMALVIAPGTTGLTPTPKPKATDSQLVETRLFKLSSYGSAHVEETSETSGVVDANYRAWYGLADTKKVHEDLEKYAREAYLAKTLTKVSHGPADDVSTPFALTLVIDDAKRGTTALDEALVAIFPNMLLGALPRWFGKAPEAIGPDTTADAKHEMEVARQSREKTYNFRPYMDERRVRILIPDGFALRALPPNKTTHLGTATLVEEYSTPEKGVVLADYKFDSGPGTLTADEAVAMRDAVVEFEKQDYIGVYFDQVGSKELAAGHIRVALEADRALIANHPSEGLPHVHLSRALLEAGIGDEARAEAKRATELEPKLAIAFNNLGWTLEHDSLGKRFGKGFDLAAAIAAYKRAIELDPDNNDSRFDLAILYEFDARGIRYADDADSKAATAAYRELIERTKESDPNQAAQYRENLLFTLFYSKQYAELDKMLEPLPFSNSHAALRIASATAQHGVNAGIAQASRGNAAASERNKILISAGDMLARARLYPEASAILEAGVGGSDAPTTARQIELYKNLKPASLAPLPSKDPASPAQRLTLGILSGTLTRQEIVDASSPHAYSSEAALQREIDKELREADGLASTAESSGLGEMVLVDLVVGNTTFSSTGDDESGYAIEVNTLGGEATHIYVVREDGKYRVVGDNTDTVQLGNETLYALDHHELKLAKAILDWKRDLTHKGGGDDTFAGPLLPRFWTVGSSKPGSDSPEAMRLAAFSLIAGSMDAKPYLTEISAARDKASGQKQTDLDLLLATAAVGAEQPELALPAAKRLMDQDPDSLTAVRLAGTSYAMEKDTKDWLEMLAPLVAKKPKDRDLLIQKMSAYEAANDFADARKVEESVIDSGKATDSDYNNLAWMGLFDNHLGEAEIKAAQQSNMISKNGSFADLHTLACVYAAEGKTTEARQVLKQAMEAGNQSEPNSEVWYALGLIYEQYGARDAALTAYRKVQAHEFDDHTYIDPGSTYLLAQARIGALTTK